jgi:hypothetical protein
MIFCWIGAAVSIQESDLALDYGLRLHEALTLIDGRPSESLLVKVVSGEENSMFTDYFLDWDKVDEDVIEANEISQLLFEMKMDYEETVGAHTTAASEPERMPSTDGAEEPPMAAPSIQHVLDEMTEVEVVSTPLVFTAAPVQNWRDKYPARQAWDKSKTRSKWGEFKQDMSFADIYPEVDPSQRFDYSTLKTDYETLKTRDIVINPLKKEAYLDDKIFSELFGCTKTEFDALPLWKRNEKKKKVGLF